MLGPSCEERPRGAHDVLEAVYGDAGQHLQLQHVGAHHVGGLPRAAKINKLPDRRGGRSAAGMLLLVVLVVLVLALVLVWCWCWCWCR